MNRLLLSSCSILTLFCASPSFADEITADSHLTAATVYNGRATLTRQAVVNVPAGAHTIVFNNLSAELMPDSLRAEGSAMAKVTFGALTNRIIAGAELAAPREKELNDQLIALNDKRKSAEDEKTALTDKRAFLTTIGQQGAMRTKENIAELNLKPEEWLLAAKSIHSETADTLKALQAQDVLIRDIGKQIGKIQEELSQLQTGQSNTYQVSIPIEVQNPTQLTVDLNYQIPNANWVPIYDARLDTKTGKLDLVQYGAVNQNSGEDWTGISLTLSTAQPQRGTGLPDLQPLWLSLYDYNNVASSPAQMFGATARMDAMEMGKMDAPAAPIAEEAVMKRNKAEFAVAAIDNGGFVSEYKIPGPSTVKADGSESKLMIGAFANDSKMQIQIKPQISSDAYLVANTTLKGDSPILAGQVNLFRDGAYVGQGYLPLMRPDESQNLAFGIDDQVSVKRKVMKDERSEAGVISKDAVIERHFITEIQNLHKNAVDISVLETIPTSQDKQIKTEILADKTTSGYKTDVDNIKGMLEWKASMEPKQKNNINLGWKVSWPQDKNLSGL